MSVSKLKQQVSKKRNDTRFAAADKNRVASIELRRATRRAPGSRLKAWINSQDLLPFAWFLLVDFSLVIAIDDATGHARIGAKKYRTRSRKKVPGRRLQNTVGRVSRSRDLFLFGLIKKKGKRAGLPKRIRGGGHNTRIETAVFSGSFFFTQVRQITVVFLRTLRNAATRLVL